MNESLDIELTEDPIENGRFRTKNDQNQSFRPNLVDRGTRLSVKVDIVGLTHGHFSTTNEYATMLVFETRFIARGGPRFKEGTVTFRFEDADGVSARDPVVHDIAPKERLALNKTEKVQDLKWGANAGANAGVGPVGTAELGVVWEMTETRSRTHYTAVSGEKRLFRRGFTGEDNTVIWALEENSHTGDGIPSFLRSAVLLRRREDVPFSFTVNVKTDVSIAGKVRSFFGLERKDPIDPVDIDPKEFPEAGRATVQSLDPNVHNLSKMEKLNLKRVGQVMVSMPLDGDGLTTTDDLE